MSVRYELVDVSACEDVSTYIPLTLAIGTLVSVLTHVVLVGRFHGAHAVRSSELVGVEEMFPSFVVLRSIVWHTKHPGYNYGVIRYRFYQFRQRSDCC